jgi:hypothetical protein
MNTFTEVSPSATGFRLVCFGRRPDRRRAKKGPVEIYDGTTKDGKPGGRYLTITGQHVEGTPVEICERQEQLAAVYRRELLGEKPSEPAARSAATPTPERKAAAGSLSDEDIIAKAGRAKNRSKFLRLWAGDTSGYPSHSEADGGLCGCLAFFTRDEAQIDRLFRRSGLMRDKWEREDYRTQTIAGALATVTETYKGNGHARTARVVPPAQDVPAGDDSAREKARTGYAIILDYFREKYLPRFRRGAVLFSEALGREVRMGEALAGAPIALVTLLATASDPPRDRTGNVDGSALPRFFFTWARSAWVDMLSSLPEEDQDDEVNELAREEFRAKVAAALHRLESFGYRHRERGEEREEVQRRSLVSWCQLWAKVGPWQGIRSLQLWACLDPGDGRLRIALRKELFATLPGHSELARLSTKRFTVLAEKYDVGIRIGKVKGQRGVELTPEFIAELLAQPGDRDERTHSEESRAGAGEKMCPCVPNEENPK